MEPVPKFDVTINLSRNPGEEKNLDDVTSLVSQLKPEWGTDIEAKILSGGHINAIVKVLPAGGGDGDAVVVKIQSPNTKVREDLASMVLVMRVAAAGGVGAPVLGEFNNGFVYQYTTGELMHPDAIPHDRHIQKLVAEQLARFHAVDPQKILPEDLRERLPKEPRMFKDIYNFLSLIPEDLSELYWKDTKLTFTRAEFQKELSWVQEELSGCDDEVLFCHNDCWWPNQIYDREKDKVSFIDLDFSNYNYVTRDIVNYFMHGRFELIPNKFCRLHMFTECEKRLFFRAYLEKRRELEDSGKAADDVTEDDVTRMVRIAKPMELGMVLDRMGVCMFINNHDYPVDYIWITNWHWEHYAALKKEYLTLKALNEL